MKPKFFLGLLLALVAVSAVAADQPLSKSAQPAAASTNAPSRQIIAYYFHGSVRCRTCQRIEMLAKETIENNFETDLNAKRLVFKPVNYDLPENAHFLKDYELPCPSLVLVRRDNGKDTKGTLLGKTWDLIGDEAEFNRYIETEVNKCLRGGTNSSTNAVPAGASTPKPGENIEHPTSNAQHPIAAPRSVVGCWMFDVECWMFSCG